MHLSLEDIQRYVGDLWLQTRALTDELLALQQQLSQAQQDNERLKKQNAELMEVIERGMSE